ncbi:MAG TPA: MFS transporter [Candidatus Limnocylindria bacterium]|nr:MFS transporter [Candidatus Limnocylindria bacterium]
MELLVEEPPREAPSPVPPGLDRYAKRAVWASAVGYAMDGFDLLILGFALPSIVATFGLTGGQAGALATLTLIGALAGGIVFGIVSDRHGRVRVLTWSIVLFALCTGASALAPSYAVLAALRFVAGLGLGGEYGIGMTLVAEASPPSRRARATSYVALGWQAGVVLAAAAAGVLLPVLGWRGLFALGALPALAAFTLRLRLREPAPFRAERVHAGALRELWSGGALRTSIGVLVLTSVQNFGYFGLMIWLPTYLGGQLHLGFARTGIWTVVTIAGMSVGIFVFGILADRVGRRPVFWAFQAGAAIAVVVYSTLRAPLPLLAGGAVMGFFVNGMMGGYGALIAELYPTRARATAQNLLFNLGRAVGGFGPVVFAVIGTRYSLSAAIALLAVLYVLDIVATAVCIPERRGAALR